MPNYTLRSNRSLKNCITKKYLNKYKHYIFLALMFIFTTFFEEEDGKYALFTKSIWLLIFLYLSISLLNVIVKNIKFSINHKKIKIGELFFLMIVIVIFTFALLYVERNLPNITMDLIKGKQSTTLEISDKSIELENLSGNSKHYISGTTLSGKDITFEVGSSTYVQIMMINHATKIDIEYWEHSKTLYSWNDVSN